MCQNCLVKTIHHTQHHFGWDNSLSPALRVASGSQLEFHCLDAANGWFNAGSTAADIPTLPFDKLNPVSGPVYVEGAQPGDARGGWLRRDAGRKQPRRQQGEEPGGERLPPRFPFTVQFRLQALLRIHVFPSRFSDTKYSLPLMPFRQPSGRRCAGSVARRRPAHSVRPCRRCRRRDPVRDRCRSSIPGALPPARCRSMLHP